MTYSVRGDGCPADAGETTMTTLLVVLGVMLAGAWWQWAAGPAVGRWIGRRLMK